MFKNKILPVSIIITLLIISSVLFIIRRNQYNAEILIQQKLSKMGPIITLKGAKDIKMNLFSNYSEAGFFASDASDGDLTAKVTATNDIKIDRIGKYSVNYLVKDSDGKSATATRLVEVMPPATNNTAGIPILMYHFFYNSSIGETAADSNFTEISNFDQQLKYLKDNQYYFPTWSEMSDYLDGKLNLPAKSVIVTDDDGSESFFRLAYPVIVKYQVPVTSFLVTSWANPNNFNVDRKLISFQSHSHAMHQAGCSTGHGGKFMCIDYQSGIADLNTSKQILGSSDVFCYPFGDYNDAAKQMLRDTGYKMAVTTEYGKAKIGEDKLRLPRIRIPGTLSLDGFISSIQ